MYALHPLLVHLPIGLLFGNALLSALYLRRGDRTLEASAYHCLWLGWLLLLPAVLSGTYAAVSQLTSASGSSALGWINAHAALGIALVVVYWNAWQVRRRNPAVLEDQHTRRSFVARLALGVVLLVIDGWIGGHMVYVLGVGVQQ